MLSELNMASLESALGSFLANLRNDGRLRGINNNQAWGSAKSFVADTVSHLSASSANDYGKIHSRLMRLDRLYSQVSPARPKPPAAIRALPATVVEDIYEIFSPTSPRNPFRTEALQWRNYLMFLLMLHLGLRRGEIAILPADAIKSDFDITTGGEKFWLNVAESPYEDEDSRFNAPSLKTAHSRRQLPLTEEVVAVSDILLGNYRHRASHSYLFGSQHGKALSLRSIHRVFEVVSEHLSPSAKKALSARNKSGITAHDLRHTCAVYRLGRYVSLGDDLDIATEKLRIFFGWSPSSPMPRHYARAYFESNSADMWDETYDRVLTALRSLSGKEQ
ncbi:tyrosine-type recombinase/integrase [Pseudomonas sp. PDM31]|uniref:tyrosine-type recombinase/integrase n=1 Tax=Pseudomonas sp. PDM31 TaxID=2854778 RepID=UPI001C437344|nr:tyrosine-type recombinase/integrase [Pseudomonas sp. PDM31]MBV7476089.1 tyrosine-type recombinase/integrase [Pseudomonas sp. PDM31]